MGRTDAASTVINRQPALPMISLSQFTAQRHQQKMAAAAEAIGAVHEVVTSSPHKATILAHQGKNGVKCTAAKDFKDIKSLGIRKYLTGLFRTNKNLRRIACDLQQHGNEKVRAAALDLLQYCKNHPGRQSNTAELVQKVSTLHDAARRADKPAAVPSECSSEESVCENPTRFNLEIRLDDSTSEQAPSPNMRTLQPGKPTILLELDESGEESEGWPQEAKTSLGARGLKYITTNLQGPIADAHHRAATGLAFDPMAAKFMFASLFFRYSFDEGQAHGQPLGIGQELGVDMVTAQATSTEGSGQNEYQQFAQAIQAMGRVYADCSFNEDVQQAGQTLVAMAAPVLNGSKQSITLSEELLEALYTICTQCADLPRTDLKVAQFYDEQGQKKHRPAET